MLCFMNCSLKEALNGEGGSIRKAGGTLLDIRIACLAYLGMAILSWKTWKQDN